MQPELEWVGGIPNLLGNDGMDIINEGLERSTKFSELDAQESLSELNNGRQ